MAFDNLSDKLAGVFKRLRSKGKLNEADVKTARGSPCPFRSGR